MKTVGRRKAATGLDAGNQLQKLVIDLRGDKPFAPRGVYRFKTHADADRWWKDVYAGKFRLAASAARSSRRKKTSK